MSQSLLPVFCLGGVFVTIFFTMLIAGFFTLRYLHARHIVWTVEREQAQLQRLQAKYGVIQAVVENGVVFNPVATYYIAKGATKLELIKDTDGKFALQFNYADDDGSHTYALLDNGVMHMRINGQWRLYGTRAEASDMLTSMKERKQLPSGAKENNNPQRRSDGDGRMTDEQATKHAKKRTRFDKKQRNLPDGYVCVQISTDDGPKWVIQVKRDENGN